MAQRDLTVSKDSYFQDMDMVVNDWWLIVGEQEYDMAAIASAKVVDVPRKSDWRAFAIKHLAYLAISAVIWAILTYIGWDQANNVFLFWLVDTVWDTRKEKKRPINYALVLNTNTGPIRIATEDSRIYPELAADEINKRIKRRPLLPNPLLPPAQEVGEPTKQM